jgi:glycosyltransferase involved in cell wall biosynthesis
MKELRLLAIVESRVISGPARNLLEFIPLAHAKGIDTNVVTFLRRENRNVFTDRLERQHVPFSSIPESGPLDFSIIQKLKVLVAQVEPNLVQTHSVKSHFLLSLSGIHKHIPWIAFHHGYTSTSVQARFYNELDRWSLKSAAKIITVSHASLEQLRSKGIHTGKATVVHNAVPSDYGAEAFNNKQVEELRASLGIPGGRKVVLCVGRLSREKDQLSLVRAMSRLRSPESPHLVIVGEGPDRELILQEVRSLGMADRTTLAGQQNHVAPFYGLADALVIPSRSEGSPNALLEALSVGVPVVATAVGGIPEMVVDDCHVLLARPGDASHIADCIDRVFSNRDNTIERVTRGKALVEEKFSPSKRANLLADIYVEVLESTCEEQSSIDDGAVAEKS